MAAARVAFPTPLPHGSVRELVEGELSLEEEEILTPVTDRLGLIAEALDRGEEVDPVDLTRGVGLLERYDREIHAPRVGRLLALFPRRSNATAAPGVGDGRFRRFHRKAVEQLDPPGAPGADYDRIVHGERTAGARVSVLKTFVDAYRAGGWGARERLASVLKGYLVADKVWARAEREYVLHALDAELPPGLDRQVRLAVTSIANARVAVQSDVHGYVVEPIALRPGSSAGGAPRQGSGARSPASPPL